MSASAGRDPNRVELVLDVIAAREAAAALVSAARRTCDPAVAARLVAVAEQIAERVPLEPDPGLDSA